MRALTLFTLLGVGILGACGDKDDTGGDDSTTDGGSSDGGSGDGGSSDGGTEDGGSSDGGSSDGGTEDGGAAGDADGDGYTVDEGDCDDDDAGIHPGAPDEPYDGIDSDCDGHSDYDWDGDGYDHADYGGEDCDDDDPGTHPDAPDEPYDSLDSDCDGYSDYDWDRDGYDSSDHGGRDCDDADDSVHPDADDTPYDGIDTDCDGWSDWDADFDGHDAEIYGGDDCDDSDATVIPDGYDTPNDGIDQDCDGEDRSFDGVVLAEGGRTTWTFDYSLGGAGEIDVTVLMDTTSSMGGEINALDFEYLADEMSGWDADFTWGFATFDDYAYGSYGYAGYDKPFTLGLQQTDDVELVQEAVEGTSTHYGGDGPESSIEGLYQALTGAGYDQGCDGDYDATYDVLPFLASDDDPFDGGGGESWDEDITGGGTLGGVGFRDGATPIVIYVTDNYLRDPDDGYGSPDGCPGDAGSSDVIDAATDLGAWVVGMCTATYCTDQMEELAEAGGWMLDLDDDGDEDPLAYEITSSSMNAAMAVALNQVISTVDLTTVWEEISLEVVTDAYGLVLDIDPDPAEDVDTSLSDTLTFTVTFYGAVPATTVPLDVTVTFQVVVEGEVDETVSVDIEIPPA